MKFKNIEGATPLNDSSGLKIEWVLTQEELNQVEVENIAHASNKYLIKRVRLPDTWFKVSFFSEVHRSMFGDVWEWAGNFRTTQTIPGVASYRIRGDLESLCREVIFWQEEGAELTILERAARIHQQLSYIHPFPNGNGRFARLIADRYLISLKCSIPQWPVDISHEGHHRKKYIELLKEADRGNLTTLIQYMEAHGAKEPSLNEVLVHTFFRQSFKGKQLDQLKIALLRRGYVSQTFIAHDK